MGDEEKQSLLNKKKVKPSRCTSGEELTSLRSCLRWMCVDQSNTVRASLSWFMFIFLAILIPILSHLNLAACVDCDNRHRLYDDIVQLSLSSLATVSFLFISRFVRKYGLRRFIHFDKLCRESEKVRQGYTAQLQRSLKLLAMFVLPCLAVEAAYKVWRYSSGRRKIAFFGNVYISDATTCILELCSWLYRTSIFFLVCVLFRLICYLQILRLQDFAQVFEEESDVAPVLKEHLRIRRHLRVISHRNRVFILSSLIIITVSLLISLLYTTRSDADISIDMTGELALCSVTLMAGLFILLRSATKITHKAQSITCLAAKWHICATLNSFDSPRDQIVSSTQLDANGESEEDESAEEEDDINTTKIIIPASANTICFQKRQALVMYFENNQAGITVFGFMLDRTYLNTIFGIELSLVLWLLGVTVGIS